MRNLVEYGLVILIVLMLIGVLPIQFFTVISGSMEPTIATGSVVLVNKMQTVFETNDMITFLVGDQPVTHRVIAVEDTPTGRYYTTQGDANNAIDPGQRTADQIVGKVMFAIPWIGTLILLLQQHLLLLVGMSVIGYGIFSIVRKKRANAQTTIMEELS